jgi:hypothetical protein
VRKWGSTARRSDGSRLTVTGLRRGSHAATSNFFEREQLQATADRMVGYRIFRWPPPCRRSGSRRRFARQSPPSWNASDVAALLEAWIEEDQGGTR